MYSVVVENTCACFIKSKKPYKQDFKDMLSAYAKANEMLAYMEKNFCKKHHFRIDKSIDGQIYKIIIS